MVKIDKLMLQRIDKKMKDLKVNLLKFLLQK